MKPIKYEVYDHNYRYVPQVRNKINIDDYNQLLRQIWNKVAHQVMDQTSSKIEEILKYETT